MVKVVRSISVDPEVMRAVITKAQFYGYRSSSDLIEALLRRWVEAPEAKQR